MYSEKLLFLLSDGEFKSGVYLSKALSVSRTTVWKALNDLSESIGVDIEKVKGKGYRLVGGVNLINREDILCNLHESFPDKCISVNVLRSVGSTNQELMAICSGWLPKEYNVVIAERQTAGRGRRGKVWHSPFAKNIYMSLGFVFEGDVSKLEGLSIVVGLVVAKKLKCLGLESVKLKWPNDIYVDGKKLGGILIELSGEFNSRCCVVIGVGLNVDMGDASLLEIDQPWTTLYENNVELDRTELASSLLNALIKELDSFFDAGLKKYVHEWKSFDYLYGKDVQLVGQGLEGKAEGVGEDGCLLLSVGGGICRINAGEVSVKLSSSAD